MTVNTSSTTVVAQRDAQVRRPPVVLGEQDAERRPGEGEVAGHPLGELPLLDAPDDRGVDADAGVREEPAIAGTAERDAARRLVQPLEQDAGGLDRVARQAEGSREDVRAAAGQHGHGHAVPASPFATSFTVPSPPRATTRSSPRSAAPAASSPAWPGPFVSTTSTRNSEDSAPVITSRA